MEQLVPCLSGPAPNDADIQDLDTGAIFGHSTVLGRLLYKVRRDLSIANDKVPTN
jgi:hypothetical protein